MLVADGIQLMRRFRVDIAPVLHAGKVTGIVSLRELERSTNHGSSRIRDVVPQAYVTHHALPPDTDLASALELTRATGAEFVLVLDQGRLVGIVSTVLIATSMGASPGTSS
jgi:CBS domain-containing protein